MRIDEIKDRILEINRKIDDGVRTWDLGEDPFEMAACDPSDIYMLERERDELEEELAALGG